jgi:site-specific DNA recombinase
VSAARDLGPEELDGTRADNDQEEKMPKTAWLYLRVSTSRQASKNGESEGYSLPAQRAACTRKALELGAEVTEEFIDAGETARTTDRDGLQDMLRQLKQAAPDYIVVHKIDRLARDLADDVAIGLAITKAGAQLVSVSEPIDGSPTGMLVHGIMASLAQFYSLNLGLEAKKGLHEKARRGGTPSYAPIGYLNSRKTVDGVEIKTVIPDPERYQHILWAFDSYATGMWSVAELAEELEKRGLKSRATRKFVGSPLTRSMVHRMLSNPYYIGKVRYGGVVYDGKHQPIVDEVTFFAVQTILANRRLAGDRSWKRQQYLKGSVYCGRCGERLGYGHSTGRGGEYPYFFCLGRHRRRSGCAFPYTLADKVEEAVQRVWSGLTFTEEWVKLVGEVIDLGV